MTENKSTLAYDVNLPLTFHIDWGVHGMLKMLADYQFESVLGIGAGTGEHKRFFEAFGKKVFSVDVANEADYVGDILTAPINRQFDAIWCSHVLEHQCNVGIFLQRIFDLLADDGVLGIILPTHPRERLVAGHLTSWSISLLCYNLVMAGFDCSKAAILDSYELSLVVKKRKAIHQELNSQFAQGTGDDGVGFSHIKSFFPFDIGSGTEIKGPGEINWGSITDYCLPKLKGNKLLSDVDIVCKNWEPNSAYRPHLFKAEEENKPSQITEEFLQQLFLLFNEQKFEQVLGRLAPIEAYYFDSHSMFYLLKGISLAECGKINEGVDILLSGLDKFPENNDFHLYIGKFYVGNNSHELEALARKHLSLFIEKVPNNIEALRLYAKSCENVGPVEEVLIARKNIFTLDSCDLDNCIQLARVLFSCDLIEESLQLYTYIERELNSEAFKEEYEKVKRFSTKKEKGGNKNKLIISRFPKTKKDIEKDFYDSINKYVMPVNQGAGRFICKGTKFFTAGSCFARHIASSLNELGYDVHRLALDETVNTTYANKYLFYWLAEKEIPEKIQVRFQELCKSIGVNKARTRENLKNTSAIILTIGVAPCFFDKKTGDVVLPSPGDINFHNLSNEYLFRNTSVKENEDNILEIINSIRLINKKAPIFLTISPVPLNTSFEMESAVVADCLSKCTLRIAVNEVLNNRTDNVFYFPSFEVVRWLYPHIGSPFGGDDGATAHVNQSLVRDIIRSFVESHTDDRRDIF